MLFGPSFFIGHEFLWLILIIKRVCEEVSKKAEKDCFLKKLEKFVVVFFLRMTGLILWGVQTSNGEQQ